MSDDAKVTIDTMKNGNLPTVPTPGEGTTGIDNSEQRGFDLQTFGLHSIQKNDE